MKDIKSYCMKEHWKRMQPRKYVPGCLFSPAMLVVLSVFCWVAREIFGNWTVKHCSYKAKTMNITETYRLSFRTRYPEYQRFFLGCDEELRRPADTPKHERQSREKNFRKPRMKSLWHPGYGRGWLMETDEWVYETYNLLEFGRMISITLMVL